MCGRCSGYDRHGRYGRHKIIEVWEYRNVGMGIWDTKELDKTGQDTEGMKNEGRKQGRREGRKGSKEGRPRKEERKVKEGRKRKVKEGRKETSLRKEGRNVKEGRKEGKSRKKERKGEK